MKLLLLLLFITLANSQETGTLTCNYQMINVNGTANYGCMLVAANPNGDEVAQVDGTHMEGFGNDDVIVILSSTGQTTIVPQSICSQFPNLEFLDVSFFGIQNITATSFSGCTNVHWLRLWMNPLIGSLPVDTFANNRNITYLDLDNIGLTSIPENLFAGTPNIEMLEIRNNQFDTIPTTIFAGMTRLFSLWMDNCNITVLNPGWFANTPSLTILDLFNNRMQTLPSNSFDSVFAPNLLVLDVGLNPFANNLPNDVFHPLTGLRNFYMSYIPTMTQVQLDWFSQSPNILSIALAFNRIEDIPNGFFSNNQQLISLLLWSNQIKTVDRRWFGESVTSINYLDFDENVINAVDRRLLNETSSLSTLYMFDNLCVSSAFFSFQLNREQHMARLEPCFRNFDFNVDTFTEGPDYRFLPAPVIGIQVRVSTTSEIQFALTPFPFEWTPMIEIFIGAQNNTRTIIRRNGSEDVAVVPSPNIVNPERTNGYRITWTNHVILVFREGEDFPFIAYTLQDFFRVENYGIRSPQARADWIIQPIEGQPGITPA